MDSTTAPERRPAAGSAPPTSPPPPRGSRPARSRCAASRGSSRRTAARSSSSSRSSSPSSVVGLASPFLLRAVIDTALPQQDLRLLVLLTAGMVAVAAVTSVLGVVQTWISTQVGQRVMHGLRTDVFAHLQRQSIAFFTRTRTGEVQSRITNDIGGMQSVVTSTATSIASNLTTTVATAVAMAALSWRLSLISLVVLPPAIWLTRRVARMRREITAAQQRELADLNVTVEEGLSINGIQLAKTLGTGPALVRRFTESSRPADRPRAPLAARRSLADGVDERDLRRHPGGHLPQRRAADDRRHDDDRHPDRLHHPAGPAVPAADGAAQHRRPGDQLARAVPARLRVPRPARRRRRARRPGRPRPGQVRGDVRFEHVGFRYPERRRPGAGRRRPRRPGRHHARAGRRDRLGQDHARLAGRPPARPDRRAGDSSTVSTYAGSGSPTSRRSSASSARRPTCCTPRSARTCATPSRTPPTPRSRTPRAPRGSTT